MKKFLTCVMSLIPLLTYAFIIIVAVVIGILDAFTGITENDIFGVCFGVLCVVVALFLVIATYAVMIRDIVVICKDSEVKSETKAIWSIALYMLNMWAFPVFWFMYDRKK